MKLTEYQLTCVEKAKRYKKRNMNNSFFRRLYINAGTDGYISAQEFTAMVNETNVIPITPKIDKQPIRDYIAYFEKWVLGKGVTEEERWQHELETERKFHRDGECYQCEKATAYIFADGRCKDCTRLTPDEVRGTE